ncbi:MAG: hypothetical protein V1778_02195 [bacterium]
MSVTTESAVAVILRRHERRLFWIGGWHAQATIHECTEPDENGIWAEVWIRSTIVRLYGWRIVIKRIVHCEIHSP